MKATFLCKCLVSTIKHFMYERFWFMISESYVIKGFMLLANMHLTSMVMVYGPYYFIFCNKYIGTM